MRCDVRLLREDEVSETDFEAPVRGFKDTALKKDKLSDVDLDRQEGARPTCHFMYPIGLTMMQAHQYTLFAMASQNWVWCHLRLDIVYSFIEHHIAVHSCASFIICWMRIALQTSRAIPGPVRSWVCRYWIWYD